MIDINRTLRLLDVEAESNFVQAEAIDAINYLLRENARLRVALRYYAEENYNGYNGSGAFARAAIREGGKDE